MKTQVCVQCKIEKPITAFKLAFAGQNAKNGYNQKESRKSRCSNCYAKRDRISLVMDAFDALGWQCACCGEDDIRFLSLDHVQGGGNIHREESNLNNQQVYREARREGYPKDKWQILCMNCNTARWRFNSICPHKLNNKVEYIQEQMDFIDHTDQSFRQHYNKEGLKLGPQKMHEKAQDPVVKLMRELSVLGFTEQQIKDALLKI